MMRFKVRSVWLLWLLSSLVAGVTVPQSGQAGPLNLLSSDEAVDAMTGRSCSPENAPWPVGPGATGRSSPVPGEAHVAKHRIFTTPFASVYPYYVAKAEKKGRTKDEVDEIIRWLTGYTRRQFESTLKNKTDFETFFAEAPRMNPLRTLIKGTVCGIRVEEVEELSMREIRYLDKLVDELAKGKAMGTILRKPPEA